MDSLGSTYSELFAHQAERLCQIRTDQVVTTDAQLPVDEHGFLVPDGATDLVTPEMAAAGGALVLLGEPGIGKTTEFAKIAKAATIQGAARIHEVRGTELIDSAAFNELVRDPLSELPAKDGTTTYNGTVDLVMVIDQLDESQCLRNVPNMLRRALHGKDVRRLMLLVACRTADYPDELTAVIKTAFGGCSVADLAPLTRAAAINLVSSVEGIDGAGMIEEASSAGAGPLAAIPLTLAMLTQVRKGGNAVGANPIQLFAAGVKELISERRAVADSPIDLTPAQRQRVCGRVALLLLGTGRSTVWHGAELGDAPHDLPARSIFGLEKWDDGTRLELTSKVLREALGTAIFTGRGHGRLGFRHASFGAYLLAWYLVERKVPQPQLERLFLVAVEEERPTIPVALREAAAWLVALDPNNSSWLARADPLGLVAHSPIVDSSTVRSVIAESLLNHADEAEVDEFPWFRTSVRLGHPGLEGQLSQALEASRAIGPGDTKALLRMRTVLRIAERSEVPGMTHLLLAIVSDTTWSDHVRALAARAVLHSDPASAGPRLATVARQLTSQNSDVYQELLGTILDRTWPHWLSTSEMLDCLVPRRRRNYLGSYGFFLSELSDRIPPEDLGTALDWAAKMVKAPQPGAEPSDDPDEYVGAVEADLLHGLVDRAMALFGSKYIDKVARLLWRQIEQHKGPLLPWPTDLLSEGGAEPSEAMEYRRILLEALIREAIASGEEQDEAALKVVHWIPRRRWRESRLPPSSDWVVARRSRIVDREDFTWLYYRTEEIASTDPGLARGLARAAAEVFYPEDSSAFDLAYSDKAHLVWEHVKGYYEPVPFDSDSAKWMKRNHAAAAQSRDPWPEVAEFTEAMRTLFASSRTGDTDAFWNLAWSLQIDPESGSGFAPLDDDLLALPGVAVLDASPELLADSSLKFLTMEHDRRTDWLDSTQINKVAWAGYVALVLLLRMGRIEEVPEPAWSNWAGAILWYNASTDDQRRRKQEILAAAARHADESLEDALAAYIRRLSRGEFGNLDILPPDLRPAFRQKWIQIMMALGDEIIEAATASDLIGDGSEQSPEEMQAKFDTWERLLENLSTVDTATAADEAIRVVKATAGVASHLGVVARCLRQLLIADAGGQWRFIAGQIHGNADLGRRFAAACALGRSIEPILPELGEANLADLFRLLSSLYPTNDDPVHDETVHSVSGDDEARRFRDYIPRALADMGTAESVAELSAIYAENSESPLVLMCLVRARRLAVMNYWSAPAPEDLTLMLADSARRLVRNEAELASTIIETLDAIQDSLPTHCELLWDRTTENKVDVWSPKPEAALCAYLTHELDLRLAGRGVAVNREVLVKPTGAYGAGDRTDILVEAHPPVLSSENSGPIRVVIEVKMTWNPGLHGSQRDQLINRYLPATASKTGIYVVGWPSLDQWNRSDASRKKACRVGDVETVREKLSTEAAQAAADLGVRSTPYILVFSRPAKSQTAV
ncbi:NACHT domain-containing protein [Nocardioides sp. WG-D5]